jgi:hypothetical protein
MDWIYNTHNPNTFIDKQRFNISIQHNPHEAVPERLNGDLHLELSDLDAQVLWVFYVIDNHIYNWVVDRVVSLHTPSIDIRKMFSEHIKDNTLTQTIQICCNAFPTYHSFYTPIISEIAYQTIKWVSNKYLYFRHYHGLEKNFRMSKSTDIMQHMLRLELGFAKQIINYLHVYSVEDDYKLCTIKYHQQMPFDLSLPTNAIECIVALPTITKTADGTKLECGIDLGIRTFATVYNPNEIYSIQTNTLELIDKFLKKINNINFKLTNSDTNCVQRQKLKKGLNKYTRRMENVINDLHCKVAHEILRAYDVIYIGKIQFDDATNEYYKILKFDQFINILKGLAKRYCAEIILIDEYMTTKLCSNCGAWNNPSYGKTYQCRCGVRVDRDINAAKNILSKGKNTNYRHQTKN